MSYVVMPCLHDNIMTSKVYKVALSPADIVLTRGSGTVVSE